MPKIARISSNYVPTIANPEMIFGRCVDKRIFLKSLSRRYPIHFLLALLIFTISCSTQNYQPIDCLKEAYDKLAVDSIGESYILAQRALQGFTEADDSQGVMRSKVFIAILYQITDQNDEAVKCLQSIDPQILHSASRTDYQNFLRLSSWYAAYSNDYAGAIAYSDSLIALDSRIGNADALLFDKLNKAEILINCDKIVLAERLLDSVALEIDSATVAAPLFLPGRHSWHIKRGISMRRVEMLNQLSSSLIKKPQT